MLIYETSHFKYNIKILLTSYIYIKVYASCYMNRLLHANTMIKSKAYFLFMAISEKFKHTFKHFPRLNICCDNRSIKINLLKKVYLLFLSISIKEVQYCKYQREIFVSIFCSSEYVLC